MMGTARGPAVTVVPTSLRKPSHLHNLGHQDATKLQLDTSLLSFAVIPFDGGQEKVGSKESKRGGRSAAGFWSSSEVQVEDSRMTCCFY